MLRCYVLQECSKKSRKFSSPIWETKRIRSFFENRHSSTRVLAHHEVTYMIIRKVTKKERAHVSDISLSFFLDIKNE